MFMCASKTRARETRVACAVLTDALPLAQQLGVCAIAIPNCSKHLYRCAPFGTAAGSLCNSNTKLL